MSHSTHDHTTTVGSPLDLHEAWADVKSTGGIPGVPVPSGTPGERLTYKVGSIGVTNTQINPMFSGVRVRVSPALTPFNQVNSRQVVILQKTDAFEAIPSTPFGPLTSQAYFYGSILAGGESAGNSTNARGISVWPSSDPAETRIAICGETDDQLIPYSQAPAGWPLWAAATHRFSGFIAVFDGNCDLLWSHQFFGRSEDADCAITDVSIRVVGSGASSVDVVTYCGISSHGVELDPVTGLPTAANESLMPIHWFGSPSGGAADGASDNGAGQWDGIVGRLSNSHSTPRNQNNVSNATTDFHAVVGGKDQDGLFGIAEMESVVDLGILTERLVVVGATASGVSGPGALLFPFTNPPGSTPVNYSLGTTSILRYQPVPQVLIMDASGPIGTAVPPEGERFTCARDVTVQLDAVRADPVHSVPTRTNVIYVVGSTTDEDLFASVGATATAQTLINGTGIPGAADGFLLSARDVVFNPVVIFQKGSYHGGVGNDGLCGVACWNEHLDHVTGLGFTEGVTTPTTSVDLEVATYFADTSVAQSTALPVVVSDLLRIRRDNIVATGDQVPAAMGRNHAAKALTGFVYDDHGLGSPAGGGVAVEDRARINIVGKTPQNSGYLVFGGGRTAFPGDEAVRTVVDMVPDSSVLVGPHFPGVGRTDGTGQPLPIVAGANGGTTSTIALSTYGRQLGGPLPLLQRILIDWEGALTNPAALLIDRPPADSNIVAAFINFGIPANPLPFTTSPLLPGCELWMNPFSPFTTSISQFFFPGTDQSVRIPLALPGAGNVFLAQAVCMLSTGQFAASPGLVFRL